MPDDADEEDYEILPEKEIKELKEELKKLKQGEVTPNKQFHISMLELSRRVDRLTDIFDEALKAIKEEEGGLSLSERLRPLNEKLQKIHEEQLDIAEGVVTLADMIKDIKRKMGSQFEGEELPEPPKLSAGFSELPTPPPLPRVQPPFSPPPQFSPPPRPQQQGWTPRPPVASELPPPPPPPRRKGLFK